MPAEDTRDRILDTAERLFATQGIDATSLRHITAEAGVNLAAVHYHFGSKEALVRAVFGRRLGPLNQERLRLLDECEARAGAGPPALEGVVDAFIAPTLRLRAEPEQGGENLCLLMGQLFSESNKWRQIIFAEFGEAMHRFPAAFRRALPHLPEPELLWRLHFTIGAMVHTLRASGLLVHLSQGQCNPADVEDTLRRLRAFVVAGLRAPLNPESGKTDP
jgi:AcrR family transcriptional regulator